jgi:deoxycytidylate deaminase
MRLVRYCVMGACLVTSGRALATECNCRPQFETSAEASGVCSRTQDDTNGASSNLATARRKLAVRRTGHSPMRFRSTRYR